MSFWIGFSFLLLFLQAWHLFFPVTKYTFAIVVLAGVSSLIWNRQELGVWLNQLEVKVSVEIAVLFGLTGLLVACRAIGPDITWDSGMYHVQSIRWVETYPITPGLGNLHGALAFYTSCHLFYAILDVLDWGGGGNHLANGLLVYILLIHILRSGYKVLKSHQYFRVNHVYEFAVLGAVISLLFSPHISSYSTDVPVAVIFFVVAFQLFAFLATPSENKEEDSDTLFFVTTLLAVAVSLKLTALVFSAITWCIAVGVWTFRNKEKLVFVKKKLLMVLTIGLIFAFFWGLRSTILSGYPAYPSGMIAIPVAWRVPLEQVQAEWAFMHHAIRWPHDLRSLNMGQWDWLPGWSIYLVKHSWEREQIVFPIVLTVIASFAWLLTFIRGKCFFGEAKIGQGWFLLVPSIASITIWFFLAPGSRYGFVLFWLLAATIISQVFEKYFQILTRPIVNKSVVIFCFLGILPISISVLEDSTRLRTNPLFSLSKRVYFPQKRPPALIRKFTTDSGLQLSVPVKNNRCMDAPIPCTPHPASNLRLRQKGNLASGFMTDGHWKAKKNWPGPGFTEFLSVWEKSRILK